MLLIDFPLFFSLSAAIKLAIDQHSSDTEYYWTQDALEKLHFALSRVRFCPALFSLSWFIL